MTEPRGGSGRPTLTTRRIACSCSYTLRGGERFGRPSKRASEPLRGVGRDRELGAQAECREGERGRGADLEPRRSE